MKHNNARSDGAQNDRVYRDSEAHLPEVTTNASRMNAAIFTVNVCYCPRDAIIPHSIQTARSVPWDTR
jgi:hypothetical protein